MKEYIVEGTSHGAKVIIRVFAQNATDAQHKAMEQTGDRNMSFYKTKAA